MLKPLMLSTWAIMPIFYTEVRPLHLLFMNRQWKGRDEPSQQSETLENVYMME